MRVPYMRINSDQEFRANLVSLLQLDLPWQKVNFPQGTVPLVYTNKTARELLEEYLKYAPEEKQVRVNAEKGTLEFRDPPLVEIWKRLRRAFRP